ncbi:60 kDa SS-A/Ro ribonucleoprotein-like [Cimex lectularius]|uniref:TROVE domain-containing protein n=1 Tax=Cimex lectularius TaxID=79782 RepID=A0A8I6RYW0_CIMLE|nr:60 kDa SS-A/Ro ribonucleoprotein-like [Cimex lectularius]
MSERTIAESKLKRFLLYGSEEVVYFPGSRVQYGHYLGANLASLRNLLNQVDKQKIFDLVKIVQNEKLASHICIVPLVISECCKISGWKEEALEFALTVLRTDKEFLMFCKFSYEILPDIGIGPLVTKFIREWYRRLHFWELVEIVSERPCCYGWYHRDVIKLANVNSPCPPRGAAFAYATGGAELMNQLYGNDGEAREVVQHLNRVEAFKNETDTDKAVIEIGAYMHTIHTTNKSLLGNKQVWKALIRQMNLQELLTRLPTIQKKGFLRCPVLYSWDPHFVPHLCDRLESLGAVLQSKISPSRSCIEHQRWKNSSQLFCKRFSKPKSVNQDILNALKKQMEKALKNNAKMTTKNITVIVDCHNLSSSYCSHKRFVQADMAAAVTALYFGNTLAKTKVLIFKGISHQYLQPRTSLDEVLSLISIDTGDCSSTPEISLYLSSKNGETLDTDLFVVIGANVNYENYMKNVEDHRKENPRAPKFVFCSLGGIPTDRTFKYDKDVLLTSGFDDKVCQIITAFSKF